MNRIYPDTIPQEFQNLTPNFYLDKENNWEYNPNYRFRI
jgi:hypothetical protein